MVDMDCGMVCCRKNRHYIVTIFMAANRAMTMQHSLNVQKKCCFKQISAVYSSSVCGQILIKTFLSSLKLFSCSFF